MMSAGSAPSGNKPGEDPASDKPDAMQGAAPVLPVQQRSVRDEFDWLVKMHLEGGFESRSHARTGIEKASEYEYHRTALGKVESVVREGSWAFLSCFTAIQCSTAACVCTNGETKVDDGHEGNEMPGLSPETEEPLDIRLLDGKNPAAVRENLERKPMTNNMPEQKIPAAGGPGGL